ncbi:hypothetical protein ACQEV2_41105 [Streptomyces sp. CA-251387]|uniref:hypothetical protein n=1 Tax=Streptomyces sp. CA-251387 TaxID=3240064 RepID=UPI003D8D6BFA
MHATLTFTEVADQGLNTVGGAEVGRHGVYLAEGLSSSTADFRSASLRLEM